MTRIALIGAGSIMFSRQLLSALLSYKDLPALELVLEDINPEVLERTRSLVERMITQSGLDVRLWATTDQRTALEGADYVINAIQVGGLSPWKLEMEIPQKYGVIQEAGDTLGPGGIFRALRHIPPLLSIARDMEELCPDALLINYANPLAPLTWAVNQATSIRCIGLCYGVRYTVAQLLGYLGVVPWVEHPHSPESWERLLYQEIPDDVEYSFGGINHMTWILSLKHRGQDLFPQIEKLPQDSRVYQQDAVRCEVLKYFGYWATENHWHMSDYLPYFRKNEAMINHFLPQRWNLLALEEQVHKKAAATIEAQLKGEPFDLCPSMLNAPKLIHAQLTGKRVRINGNLPNRQSTGLLIENLPAECMVEVPIWVDQDGLHPDVIGRLPTQCASLCKTNIQVQELVVEAALEGNLEAARHALALDPVTATQCTLEQIRQMFDELYAAQKQWLSF